MKTWWRPSFSPLSPDMGLGHQARAESLVDAHVHVFPPEMVSRREAYMGHDARFDALYSSPKARMVTAEEVVAQMDDSGIELSVVFGFAFNDQALCGMVNDYVIDAVRAHPTRLAGLACVAVHRAGAQAELERCLDAGLRGCGELAPASAGEEEIGDLAPVAACLQERRLPLVVHASEPVGHEYSGKGRFTPEACVALAQAYQGLTIVFSHMGGGLFLYELMPEMRACLVDVLYDTAAVPFLYDPGVYEVAIMAAGAEKLIFGSDFPLLAPERCLAGLERLSPQQRAAVRSDNARRVFAL
jgi:predicted TIM-barrel fold metal-dependent hydrolase